LSKTQVAIIYETVFPEFKGGVERWFQELSKGLASSSFEVLYLNTNGVTETRGDVSYVDIGGSKNSFHLTGQRSIIGTFSYSLSLFKYLLKNDFDFIYMSSFPFLHIWIARTVRLFRKKRYQIIAEWFEIPSLRFWSAEFGLSSGWLGYAIQEITVRLPDVNISYLASTKLQLAKKMSSKKTLLTLPGICPDLSLTNPIEDDFKSKDLCQIGRFIPDKNPLLSLEVVSELISIGWMGNFTFIGSGPLEERVKEEILKRDLSDRVFLIKNASDEVKNSTLRNSAALFHPSKREGYGLVIIEAAVFGVPAVLIRSKDNKSTELGINPSLVAENEDVSELATLVMKALNDRSTLSNESRRWIEDVGPKMSSSASISEISTFMLENAKGV
jgi:glycosyltransferase involved in cell wall biosynthesis